MSVLYRFGYDPGIGLGVESYPIERGFREFTVTGETGDGGGSKESQEASA